MAKKEKIDISSDETWAILKRVFQENSRAYVWQYVAAFILLALVAASSAFPAWVVYNIVEDVFMRQDMNTAYWVAFSIMAAFTIRGFATYGYQVVLGKIANNIVARYQVRTFNHLMNMGVGFFRDQRSAFLITRLNTNITGMRNMLNDVITVFVRDLLTLIGLLTVMVIRDPFMSMSTLIILPIIYFVIARYVRRIRKVAKEAINLNSRVAAFLVETAQGIDIVKSFTMEKGATTRMQTLVNKVEKQANRIVRLNAKTKPPTEILAGFAIAAVVAFGGYRVAELGHSPGGLFSFLTAAMLAYDPARKLAAFRVNFEKSLVSARMLYEVLDTPADQADQSNAKELVMKDGKIEFNDVNFSYGDGERILKDLSFVAEPGKTTSLVGPSGGGKSTIISLLQRFYDPSSGVIEIDGQNLAEITAFSLRQNIAYVSQQPMLFEGTIMDNIRFGRPDATDEEIVAAAKLAQAHAFILDQPEGYETQVGELGSNFSGGQRQRLSIARAVLRDAPILLLDEATSALDNKSELLVQEALDDLMVGRTTIVVAHRLSTIQNADKIIVIDEGRIVEQGTHNSLIRKRDGIYSRLHGIGQFRDGVVTTKPKPSVTSKTKSRAKTTTKAKAKTGAMK